VPLAQLAWTEHAQPQAQATRAYGQAQRTGTHDEIIGGLDEALAGVEGYGASNGNNVNYKNNSKEQPLTLTNAYLTSSNVSTQNHAPATVSYYHCDQIGTPRELTDEQGAVTWSATYKAWGRVEKEQSYKGLSLAASDGEITSDYASSQAAKSQQTHQPLRLQGQYHDDETGLNYNRFRYYEPEAGRYVSPDPIGLLGGVNSYAYGPNALGWFDPLGLSKKCKKCPCPPGTMDPKRINFSQRSVTGDGPKGANTYADIMASGGWDWAGGPKLRVMNVAGQYVSYDNRRLAAARLSKKECVPVETVNPMDAGPLSGKTWGQAFLERMNDPRNIRLGGPVPARGLNNLPIFK
jgi:RHS repeat-associated protein